MSKQAYGFLVVLDHSAVVRETQPHDGEALYKASLTPFATTYLVLGKCIVRHIMIVMFLVCLFFFFQIQIAIWPLDRELFSPDIPIKNPDLVVY